MTRAIKLITVSELRRMIDADAVEAVSVAASGSVFSVVINHRFTLAKGRGSAEEAKTYSTLPSLFTALRALGIIRFDVDIEDWTPGASFGHLVNRQQASSNKPSKKKEQK